jgi:hypothetical protein
MPLSDAYATEKRCCGRCENLDMRLLCPIKDSERQHLMWAVESNSIAFSQPRQIADDAGWRRQKGAFANAGWHQQQFK